MVYEKYPSKINDEYWVHAELKNLSTPITNNYGKWLVFCYTKNLDSTWQKIAEATEMGELGPESKAATIKENPNAEDSNVKVICVYTYDSEDKSDVARIAWKLNELGVVPSVLNYKKDITTIEGKYANKGNGKLCRYSVSIHHFKDKTKDEFIKFFMKKFK